jgi:TetR/AcrR family transcriptional regulator, cholesterol catabolism regulator
MSTQSAPQARQTILEVATDLFAEKGYTGTTMRDIAAAVGILPGSLYAHIDGKETILIEVVEAAIDRSLAIESAIVDASEPADVRLRRAIKEHIEAVAENPKRALVLEHQWRYLTGANRKRIIAKRRRYEKGFTRILEDGIASGAFGKHLDVRLTVLTILGALNWVPEWYKPNGKATPGQIGDGLTDTLLAGIVKEGVPVVRNARKS